ncbi:MAG: hypothetical protein CMN34_01765 [Saprospirales bacterium]|nr:hypothetical protein [Saprospirales bacterium]|tara:strand:- start:383 stop:568 length:186 start_codon:yes stop_codon:yes gene_type:complete
MTLKQHIHYLTLLSAITLVSCKDRYDEGHEEGYDEGYEEGYDEGYEEGYDEAEDDAFYYGY